MLADVLDFTENSQKLYREMGLLDDQMLAEIVCDQSDYGRTFKWIDLLCRVKVDVVPRLVQILFARGFSWIGDEIQADLLAERGEIQLEEYVYREAGLFVHKHFGRSRRVAEIDKKAIQELIATRYQAAKEAWRRQLEKERQTKDEALRILQGENSRMKCLTQRIHAWMRIQKDQISPYAHDMESALQLTRGDTDPDSSKQDYYQTAERAVDETLQLLSSLLCDKERRDEERKRCLKMMDCTNHAMDLDILFQEELRRAIEKAEKHEKEATISDTLAKSLDTRLFKTQREMDRELTEKEKHILYTESVIRQRESTIKGLEQQIHDAKAALSEAEYELDSYKKKCELIERTRRLGYYYPGWYDKVYCNISSVEYGRRKSDYMDQSYDYKLQRQNSKPTLQRQSSVVNVRPRPCSRYHRTFSQEPTPALKIIKRPKSQLALCDSSRPTSPVKDNVGRTPAKESSLILPSPREKTKVEWCTSSNVGSATA